MRKFIKLKDIHAKRLAGKYQGTAIDPRFIDVDFNIIPLAKDLLQMMGIAKRYIKKLVNSGQAKIIDMSNTSDPDVVKLKSVFKETIKQGTMRIAKRVTKWDYLTRDINTEL